MCVPGGLFPTFISHDFEFSGARPPGVSDQMGSVLEQANVRRYTMRTPCVHHAYTMRRYLRTHHYVHLRGYLRMHQGAQASKGPLQVRVGKEAKEWRFLMRGVYCVDVRLHS
jgi:hypothetical protein